MKEIMNIQADEALHIKVSEYILRDVLANNLPPGTRLQPIRKLAKMYHVSCVTAQRAVSLLQQNGMVRARVGAGGYITEKVYENQTAREIPAPPSPAAGHSRPPRDGVFSIAIVLPQETDTYNITAAYKNTIGILEECDQMNRRVELLHSINDESYRPEFVQKILDRNIDGVIWLEPTPRHQMNMTRLQDLGLSQAVIGRRYPDITIPSLHEDYAQMADLIMDLCLARNAKNILFLTGPIEKRMGAIPDMDAVDVYFELARSSKERNLAFDIHHVCQAYGSPEANALARDFLKSRRSADIIICQYTELLFVIEELDKQNCWDPPEKKLVIDLIGSLRHFWDHQMRKSELRIGRIPVAYVDIPIVNIGKAAVRQLERAWLPEVELPAPDVSVKLILPDGSPFQSARSPIE